MACRTDRQRRFDSCRPSSERYLLATVLTAEFDPLRDEGRAYAKRLASAGVPTAYTNYDGVFHGFFGMTDQLPRARQAVDEACGALRKAFGA